MLFQCVWQYSSGCDQREERRHQSSVANYVGKIGTNCITKQEYFSLDAEKMIAKLRISHYSRKKSSDFLHGKENTGGPGLVEIFW